MEMIKKTISFFIIMIFIFFAIDLGVYAYTIPSDGIVTGIVNLSNGESFQYVKSINSQRTGGKLNVAQQGYRISLMEETGVLGSDDHAECAVAIRCILDLVNSDIDPTFLSDYSCTASYGFKNNKRYDLSTDITLQRLFIGPNDENEGIVECSDINLVGLNDTICDGFDKIQGQCKLTYRHCYEQGFLDENLFNFHGSLCYNRHIITKSMLETAGYKIKNNDDFWFYSEYNGMKTAQFYDKSENTSIRFFMALIKLFEENWSGFNIADLSKYYFIFEPIIWFNNARVEDTGIANQNLMYSFYGTLTELAYIQLNARDFERNRFGFVYIDSYNNNNRSASGAWLDDMQVCAFVDGGAMMLRTSHRLSDNEPVWISDISSDFYNKYGSSEISNQQYAFDPYCYGDYVVENMGIACLQYNPPITYTAQNYTYRTDTDVVTSIKITNNGKEDFLPSYESVSAYSAAPSVVPEPVAIGAILEYADENDNPLSASQISELGLPDFVSVQGVGSETHNSERTGVFITTPANETYLYFKWNTPDTPMKLKVTARFVGDNNKTPIYINHSVGSINGENLEYSGENPAYQGKTFTTVTFTCDIQDTIEKINENHVPPDAISGFMDMPSETSTALEQQLYAKNVEIFNNYDPTRLFNMQDYLNDPANESETVARLVWFEYTSYLDSGDSNNPVKLKMKEFRADSWMQQQDFTQTWTSGSKNPIVTFDNVPQEIKSAPNGKIYKYIPSGYGFTYAFEEDYQGRNDDGIFGFDVADEDKETVKNACTMFQNGVMLFPEFNYSKDYIRTIESCGYEWFDGDLDTYDSVHALSHNENSLYTKVEIKTINDDNGGLNLLRSRIHFIPVWFPDDTEYNIEVIMFDYWTPAGQIYDHKTYTLYIDGNIYDNWYPTKSDVNQKK